MIKQILFLSLALSCGAGEINEKFLNTLGKIESNNNDKAVGDNGKAIGRYQIWRVCYQDARDFDKSINFPYSALTNKENSDKVVIAYLNRYARGKSPVEMARIWNGGPSGDKKLATVLYGKKFESIFYGIKPKKELAKN